MVDGQYRYFIGLRPPRDVFPAIAAARAEARPATPVVDARAHVTLASIFFGERRERAILSLVEAALSNHALHACPVTLGRIESLGDGQGIAMLVADGERDGLLDLRAGLVRLLLQQWPDMPVAGGARPHLTLGYAPAVEGRWKVAPIHWLAEEIELIESWHGRTVHRTLGRWPLLPPPQYGLDFASAA